MNASYSPTSSSTDPLQQASRKPGPDQQPRKPDWLLIMVGGLFLLTLAIVWLVAVLF